jgi:hypothetical protein
MTWTTELQEDAQSVHILCAGRISRDDLIMLAIEASYLVQQHGCGSILIDLSWARLDFGADELRDIIDIYMEYHVAPTTRSGIALRPGVLLQPYATFLATAKQHGYRIELLVGEQQRKAWLSGAG